MVVLDEALVMAALESRAGTLDEATVNKMDGTGCRVGKTARGLPNVGREIESGEEIGWTSVGKEEDDASLMCFETSWFLESDRQPPSQTRIPGPELTSRSDHSVLADASRYKAPLVIRQAPLPYFLRNTIFDRHQRPTSLSIHDEASRMLGKRSRNLAGEDRRGGRGLCSYFEVLRFTFVRRYERE